MKGDHGIGIKMPNETIYKSIKDEYMTKEEFNKLAMKHKL
jgi:hypothetical protein